MSELGTLGGASSEALGINDSGTIVGRSQTSSGQWHAFMWSNGRMRDLRISGDNSFADDVNNSGVVVGVSVTGPRESPEYRAFVWDRGKATELIAPGDTFSMASAINGSGEIVGVSRGSDYRAHSILWRPIR